jgi:hypothetical protein
MKILVLRFQILERFVQKLELRASGGGAHDSPRSVE